MRNGSSAASFALKQTRGRWWRPGVALTSLLILFPLFSNAQSQPNVEERIQKLSEAMNRVQMQIENSERELEEMREELASLKGVAHAPAAGEPARPEDSDASHLAAAVEELREKQSMQNTQLAVLQQTKVESSSKYPVSISGMILMTGFVNTRQVDSPSTPSVAQEGAGSTGATPRQTVVGIDVSGPHAFGARSHADLRLDFDGVAQAGGGYGAGYGIGLLHLRTSHAELEWEHTKAFFSFDRPLMSPYTPDSITAVAVPPLAWSGNLWVWAPQIGVSRDFGIGPALGLRMQSALIDSPNAPAQYSVSSNSSASAVSTSELSRWPGVESRLAFLNRQNESAAQLGVSGYFARHRTVAGTTFDSWAAAFDLSIPFSSHLELKGSFYRGQGLGGLGGGMYKNYLHRSRGGESYVQTLDDVGGWAQWKEKISSRLELNEAIGIDNVPAHQLRPYAYGSSGAYFDLARNRTFTANAVYSPNAYLLFSIEYRKIQTSSVNANTSSSDVIGIAAGYKF